MSSDRNMTLSVQPHHATCQLAVQSLACGYVQDELKAVKCTLHVRQRMTTWLLEHRTAAS